MSKNFYAYRNPQKERPRSFSIVAIGASSGGLEAAVELFRHLPPDTGRTYVYIQHADQTQKINAVGVLSEAVHMQVITALNDLPLRINHVYIVPPDKETIFINGRFVISPLTEKPHLRLPVNRLFTAMADVFPGNIIGIVLSGVTRDGALGLRAIKEAGGITFAQDDSARFKSMPFSAIHEGVVDKILSPQQMALELQLTGLPDALRPSSSEKNVLPKETPAQSSRRTNNKEKIARYRKAKPLNTDREARPGQMADSDWQQFAHVASHDLQEPLRKIITFSDRLQQRFTDQLPETGKDYINKIISSAMRMTHLLDDLLNFSRIAHARDAFTRTDLNHIVAGVLNDFQTLVQQKMAKTHIGSLPVIEAIPHQMELLFHNLISNALKFACAGRVPEIRITVKKLRPEKLQQLNKLQKSLLYYEIVVRDNGIGFNQEFAKQIFAIFQRLNDKQEFPGTGIGLAICRKIVSNHNGDIFATSIEGKGSGFHIILPAKQP